MNEGSRLRQHLSSLIWCHGLYANHEALATTLIACAGLHAVAAIVTGRLERPSSLVQ
ncbi:hypothetical protein [Uliginosibacterium gangwonense]|uniref:hypothetical protein n=1 Tax=Uliginosibacterium gangwonense TaxID=392736 RepID=UPI000375ADDB|nr:hypothetical protein [Uliginosibacterium gangwonense]